MTVEFEPNQSPGLANARVLLCRPSVNLKQIQKRTASLEHFATLVSTLQRDFPFFAVNFQMKGAQVLAHLNVGFGGNLK